MPRLSKTIIRQRRAREGLTQEELARRAEVSKKTVENAERGESISETSLGRLAFALRSHPSDLLEQSSPQDDCPSPRLGTCPAMPSLLVGREQELERLHSMLVAQLAQCRLQTELAIVVISGVPGVGKTTIAKALAHDPSIRSTFNHGILWTTLGASPDIRSVLDSWAISLGLPATMRSQSNRQVAEQITGFLSDKAFLLIIDDAFSAQAVSQLLLGGNRCATVVTTRFPIVQEELHSKVGTHLQLSVLSEEAAFQLLTQLAPEVVRKYKPECKRFIKEIECLPLAVQIAGRMLNREFSRKKDIASLLGRLLTDKELILDENVPVDVSALLNNTPATVRAVLSLSTDLLDPVSRTRFASLAAFAASPCIFAAEHLKRSWQTDDPTETLDTLVDIGLIEPIGNHRYQMHALLVAHARTLCQD